jgi:hypothetical protein
MLVEVGSSVVNAQQTPVHLVVVERPDRDVG